MTCAPTAAMRLVKFFDLGKIRVSTPDSMDHNGRRLDKHNEPMGEPRRCLIILCRASLV
jgi:hypothetical protein